MKFKRILISTLLIASVTSSTGCSSDFFAKKTNNPQAGAKQQVYAPELDPGVHELITDQRFKSLESDEPLRFETAVTPEEAENGTAVELRDNNGKTISKMYDDGSHSDRIAGDGIYTCSYKPKPNGEETFSYTANIGGEETKPASVRYFDKITKQDIKDMQGISQKASDIESKYLDSEGYVPEDKKEDVLDEIGNYAEELKQSGEAVEYRVNKQYDNVIIKLSSGITMVYDNPTKEDAGGESSTSDTSGGRIYSVQKLNVKGYQPFSETDPHFGDNLPDVINNITSEFSSDIKSNGVTSGEDASPQVVKTFGANQVIFWAGHGGYDGNIHSYLCTTSEFNKDDYTEDDVIEDRLLVELKKSNTVRITSEYINAHCPNMTDSYVYLGSCHSLQDSVLAASFINKDCNVVFGFSNTVRIAYTDLMMEVLTSLMCQKRTSNLTGYPVDYYSIDEALQKAKMICGENDMVLFAGDNPRDPAEPVIMGNRNYRFAETIAGTNSNASDLAELTLGSFTIDTVALYVDAGSNATIGIQSFPDGYDKSRLIWTIDDDKVATVNNGIVHGIQSQKHTRVVVRTDDGLYTQACFVYVR